MKTRRLRAGALAGILAAVGSIAILVPMMSAPAYGAPAPSRPVVKVAYTGTIDSLNPFIAIYGNSLNVLNLEYESLTNWGSDNNETGQLAASWSTSSDGKTWTYKLRPGMTWSDGQPITSADAVWSFNAAMKNSALQAANGSLIAPIASVTAPDANTVRITTKQAQAPDPALDMPVVPAHVWSKLPDPAKFADDSSVVGSGPYLLKSYAQNQSVILTANPHWHGGTPPLSGVDYISYKDVNAAVAGLQSGDVDVVKSLTPLQYNSLKNSSGIGVASPLSEHYWSLNVNPGALDIHNKPMGSGNPVLHDPVVRQAIQQAIDDKTLVNKVLDGFGSYGPGIIPPAYPTWYLPNSSMRPFNIDAANALLDKAGYKKGPDGIRLDKSGKPITLRLMWESDRVMSQQVVSYVVPWLQQLGIKITSMPESEDQLAQNLTQANYDILWDGWGVSPDPDFMLYINTCASRPNADGTGNTSAYFFCDPRFDQDFAAQHTELNKATRAQEVQSALKTLYDAAVVNVLFYDAPLDAYRSGKFSFPQIKTTGVDGYWAFTQLHTAVKAGGGASSSSGVPAFVWVIVAIGVVALGGGAFTVARRRRLDDDTE